MVAIRAGVGGKPEFLRQENLLCENMRLIKWAERKAILLKPIKLKELLKTAKDHATQQIAVAENYALYVVPLFEGLVKDVDETLGERILSDWRVETDSTRFIALVV